MGLGLTLGNAVTIGFIIILIPNGLLTYECGSPEKVRTYKMAGRKQQDAENLLPNRETCGIQNSDRIYGGEFTDLDEHPWLALLKYLVPNGQRWSFYCSGVLISSRYVLTAAHCVVKENTATVKWRQKKLTHVRLGEWDTLSKIDCIADDCSEPIIDVPVERIIPHEQYSLSNLKNMYNDIALLRLEWSVIFTDFIKPICLPIECNLRNADFDGYDMEIAGWGTTERGNFASTKKLKVQIPVVNNTECNKIYNTKVYNRIITANQICAGGEEGKDSCVSDSGSALMGKLPRSDNWLAIGIISYGGNPCGRKGYPGVHTKVGPYIDWILSKLKP